jgi:hypothetical protein
LILYYSFAPGSADVGFTPTWQPLPSQNAGITKQPIGDWDSTLISYWQLMWVEAIGYWQLIRVENTDVCRSCDLCLQVVTLTPSQITLSKK